MNKKQQKIYKALFVKNATHKKVAVLAKKQSRTIDSLVNLLLVLYKEQYKK